MTSSDFQYPLRPRGALELFDVSLKLYKKYFWPLLGVSVFVWGTALFVYYCQFALSRFLLLGSFGTMYFVGFPLAIAVFCLLLPILYAAVGHVINAAIDGDNTTFRQCLKYARLQYKPILKSIFIAVLLASFLFACILFIWWGVVFLDTLIVFGGMDIVIFLMLTGITFFLGLFLIGHLSAMPLLASLESTSTSFTYLITRTFKLCSAKYNAMVGIVFAHGVGYFFLSLVLLGVSLLLISTLTTYSSMRGFATNDADLFFFLDFFSSFSLIGMFWSPFYLLTLGTFYIDVRIRKEAFDLEYQVSHSDHTWPRMKVL